jgi:hypothetical protein
LEFDSESLEVAIDARRDTPDMKGVHSVVYMNYSGIQEDSPVMWEFPADALEGQWQMMETL